jgi:hypothetical protein
MKTITKEIKMLNLEIELLTEAIQNARDIQLFLPVEGFSLPELQQQRNEKIRKRNQLIATSAKN